MTQDTAAPTGPADSYAPRRRSGPVGVGLIGTGMISDTYLEHLTSFPDMRVVILGELTSHTRTGPGRQHGIAEWGTAEDVLNHPDVELVVNLTIPAVHATVASASLAAGKHVWSEKPISIDRASAQALLEQAEAAGLLVGVAPDTVLGPGLQTARRAIARGDIGEPLSAQTVIQYLGPDIFHPNPEFLFAQGAGPLFDIGPYYLTALVHVFGPFANVAAVGSKGRATRTIQVGDRAGSKFPVAVPTHVGAIAQFAGGGVAQSCVQLRFPTGQDRRRRDHGTEGTLVIPDPNTVHRRHQDHASRDIREPLQGSRMGDHATHRRRCRSRHRCAGHGPLHSKRWASRWPPANSPTTSSTPWSRWTRRSAWARRSPSPAPWILSPVVDESWDPYEATLEAASKSL